MNVGSPDTIGKNPADVGLDLGTYIRHRKV